MLSFLIFPHPRLFVYRCLVVIFFLWFAWLALFCSSFIRSIAWMVGNHRNEKRSKRTPLCTGQPKTDTATIQDTQKGARKTTQFYKTERKKTVPLLCLGKAAHKVKHVLKLEPTKQQYSRAKTVKQQNKKEEAEIPRTYSFSFAPMGRLIPLGFLTSNRLVWPGGNQ